MEWQWSSAYADNPRDGAGVRNGNSGYHRGHRGTAITTGTQGTQGAQGHKQYKDVTVFVSVVHSGVAAMLSFLIGA